MAEQQQQVPSNSAGNIVARDYSSVQIGNNDFSKTFHGGVHNHTSPNDLTRDIVLQSLASHSYRERKDINPVRVPGTCQWFVSHERYKQWRQHPSSSMLRVSADPGCGKSVLARYLVDEELKTTDTTTTCYFFFKDGLGDQSSATMALRCIIHQILSLQPALFSDEILNQFLRKSYLMTSITELWELIVNLSADSAAGELILIFDAFDECSREGRTEFEKLICQFYGRDRSNGNLKLLITSRPHEVVSREFRRIELSDLPVLHLAGESEDEVGRIAKEIDLVIAARVRDLAIKLELGPDEAEDIRERLSRFRNRTYLWVHLTLDVIENADETSHGRISNIIDCLPDSVYAAYERILNRSSDKGKAQKLLKVMMAATRPLSLAEVEVALELDQHHTQHSELHWMPEHRFQKHLRDLCGLFIVVINAEVFFLHQTAREFLRPEALEGLSDMMKIGRGLWSWAHTVAAQDSHKTLGKACVTYLLLSEFVDGPENRILDRKLGQEALVAPKHFPFLQYASQNWYSHCRSADFEDLPSEALLRLCGHAANGSAGVTWMNYCKETSFRRLSLYHFDGILTNVPKPMIVASTFGVTPVVKRLLGARASSAKVESDDMRSPLSFASENGFDDIVKLLLKHLNARAWSMIGLGGRSVDNVSNSTGQTPLAYATLNGHNPVVRRLLKAGARVDREDHLKGSPIFYALCGGDDEIVNLILGNGTKVADHDLDAMLLIVLCFALLSGEDRIVARIIKTKRVAHESLITEKNPALIDLCDRSSLRLGPPHQGTPIRKPRTVSQLAACKGSMVFFEAFHEIGQPIEVSNLELEETSSLLHWAAACSSISALRLVDHLLSRGAAVDHQHAIDLYTPLHWALWAQNTEIAKLLLSRGANPYKKARDGKSAFKMGFYASTAIVLQESGLGIPGLKGLNDKERAELTESIRKLQVRFGRHYRRFPRRDTSWEHIFFKEPDFELRHLIAAETAIDGGSGLLSSLLPLCRDVDMRNYLGQTLLHCVQSESTARILLQFEVDPHVQDNLGRTALHTAILNANVNVANMLLELGVNPGIQDKRGETVLHVFTNDPRHLLREAYSPDILRLLDTLLRHKDLLNTRNCEGVTALHIAVRRGVDVITRSLLEQGANVNCQDSEGHTPLDYALGDGKKDTINVLEEFGAKKIGNNGQGLGLMEETPGFVKFGRHVVNRLKGSRATN